MYLHIRVKIEQPCKGYIQGLTKNLLFIKKQIRAGQWHSLGNISKVQMNCILSVQLSGCISFFFIDEMRLSVPYIQVGHILECSKACLCQIRSVSLLLLTTNHSPINTANAIGIHHVLASEQDRHPYLTPPI